MGGTRTGFPISPALEAATLNRTPVLRSRRLEITPVILVGGEQFVALADFSVGNQRILLRPTDFRRVALVLTNNDAAVAIRIGDQGVTPTQGVRVSAGASMRIAARADIYAISEGANVTVSMSEELL